MIKRRPHHQPWWFPPLYHDSCRVGNQLIRTFAELLKTPTKEAMMFRFRTRWCQSNITVQKLVARSGDHTSSIHVIVYFRQQSNINFWKHRPNRDIYLVAINSREYFCCQGQRVSNLNLTPKTSPFPRSSRRHRVDDDNNGVAYHLVMIIVR